jgi:hypothetical protein
MSSPTRARSRFTSGPTGANDVDHRRPVGHQRTCRRKRYRRKSRHLGGNATRKLTCETATGAPDLIRRLAANLMHRRRKVRHGVLNARDGFKDALWEKTRARSQFEDPRIGQSQFPQLSDEALKEFLARWALFHCGRGPFACVCRSQIDWTYNIVVVKWLRWHGVEPVSARSEVNRTVYVSVNAQDTGGPKRVDPRPIHCSNLR